MAYVSIRVSAADRAALAGGAYEEYLRSRGYSWDRLQSFWRDANRNLHYTMIPVLPAATTR